MLGRHENQDVLLKLPVGQKVRDLRWLSVWCRRFTVIPNLKHMLIECKDETMRIPRRALRRDALVRRTRRKQETERALVIGSC